MLKSFLIGAVALLMASGASAQALRGSAEPSPQTGTGSWVRATSPTLVTPTLGVATATSEVIGAGSAITSSGPGGALTASAFAAYTGPYLPLSGGTLTGALLFTDNTLDIGANGATRPRTGYFGTSLISPILDSGSATDTLIKRNGTTGITLGASSLATFAGHLVVEGVTSTGATGTGKFVFDTAPTLGVVIASSIALGGATIGTDKLAVTGTTSLANGAFTVNATGFTSISNTIGPNAVALNGNGGTYSLGTNADVILARSGVGALILKDNSTATVTLTVGAANLLTLNGGLTTGGLATLPTATIGTTFTLTSPGTDAATTDASLCRITSTGVVVTGTGTLGICLGTSSARYKHDIAPLGPGLSSILALKPVSYRLNADHGDPTKLLYGFTAEDMAPVLPALVGADADGLPNSADYLGLVPVLVKAVQEQQMQIAALKAELAALKPTAGPYVVTTELLGGGCNCMSTPVGYATLH